MTKIIKRIEGVANITVNELVDWCIQRDLQPDEVRITAAHLRWESPETDKERERRAAWEQARNARTEEWERETYKRLCAKYGAETQEGRQ